MAGKQKEKVKLEELQDGYFRIFDSPVETTGGSKMTLHQLIPTDGLDVTRIDRTHAKYKIEFDDGLYDLDSMYVRLKVRILNAKGGAAIAAYDPDDESTHVTIREGVGSLFQEISFHAGSSKGQYIDSHPNISQITHFITGTGEELDRCSDELAFLKHGEFEANPDALEFDTVTGNATPAFATGVTAEVVSNKIEWNLTHADGAITLADILDNAPTLTGQPTKTNGEDGVSGHYNESFIKRCNRTNGTSNGAFYCNYRFKKGPLSGRKEMGTYLTKDHWIEFTKNDADKALETYSTTYPDPYFIIDEISVMVKRVEPDPGVMSQILDGIQKQSQKFAYLGMTVEIKDWLEAQSTFKQQFKYEQTPSYVMIFLKALDEHTDTQANHHNLRSYKVTSSNYGQIQEHVLVTENWDDELEYQHMYDEFKNVCEGKDVGRLVLNPQEWKENYAYFTTDLRTSMSEMPEKVRGADTLTIELERHAASTGTAYPALQIYVVAIGDYLQEVKLNSSGRPKVETIASLTN